MCTWKNLFYVFSLQEFKTIVTACKLFQILFIKIEATLFVWLSIIFLVDRECSFDLLNTSVKLWCFLWMIWSSWIRLEMHWEVYTFPWNNLPCWCIGFQVLRFCIFLILWPPAHYVKNVPLYFQRNLIIKICLFFLYFSKCFNYSLRLL